MRCGRRRSRRRRHQPTIARTAEELAADLRNDAGGMEAARTSTDYDDVYEVGENTDVSSGRRPTTRSSCSP